MIKKIFFPFVLSFALILAPVTQSSRAKADSGDEAIVILLVGVGFMAYAVATLAVMPPGFSNQSKSLRSAGFEPGDRFVQGSDGRSGKIFKKDGRVIDVFKTAKGEWSVVLATVDDSAVRKFIRTDAPDARPHTPNEQRQTVMTNEVI